MRIVPNFLMTRVPVLLLLISIAVGLTFAEGVRKRLRFPRGATSTVVKGAVIRGDRDRYIIGAKKGQRMRVKISSLEDNAVFQIYQPRSKQTLQGADETDDATTWEGELPVSGDYVISVGGTRGNASYNLEVGIS